MGRCAENLRFFILTQAQRLGPIPSPVKRHYLFYLEERPDPSNWSPYPNISGEVNGHVLESALGPLFRRFLYHVAPTDPIVLLAAAAIFAAVGLTACLVPALRAANLDPIDTLRES